MVRGPVWQTFQLHSGEIKAALPDQKAATPIHSRHCCCEAESSGGIGTKTAFAAAETRPSGPTEPGGTRGGADAISICAHGGEAHRSLQSQQGGGREPAGTQLGGVLWTKLRYATPTLYTSVEGVSPALLDEGGSFSCVFYIDCAPSGVCWLETA